jgi:cyclophilin family peptidyl-prolyl cis-trans isomerase
MRKRPVGGKIGFTTKSYGKKRPPRPPKRRTGFECLEHRFMLSTVGLSPISNITLAAGTSSLIALNGNDPGQTVRYSVTTSDPTKVTPVVMPQTNKSVQFNINGLGAMTFQLFDNLTPSTASHIETLVNDGFYNGDYIYRAQSGFVVQGGNNVPSINNGAGINPLPNGVPATIPEEFNPDLTYTSAGTLAMARTNTPDSSSTEFFIGAAATRNLDYSYTLFGFQTVDQAITVNGHATTVLKDIEAQPTESSSGFSYLVTPIKINSASIITDTQNGVLMLKAPKGVTGSFTVTVTAFDSATNTPTTRTFTVNVVADTATGNVANPWAGKTPAAPASIVFQPQSGQGTSTLTSANNSSAATKLQFLVTGVTSGDQVTVYADGVAIGTAQATSSTVTVSTNGTSSLLDGSHTFTATQSLSTAATYTDSGSSSRNETANVASYSSPSAQLKVFTSLALTATPSASAKVGQVYAYTVQTNAPAGDTVTVTPGTLPSGMSFSGNTFTWTPTTSQANTSPSFSASVSDSLGHTAAIGPVSIAVSQGVGVTTIPVNVSLGGDVTITLSGNQFQIYDNIAKAILNSSTFNSTDTIEIDCPAGQTNLVTVVLPTSTVAALPKQVLVQGKTGSTNNQVTIVGTNGTNKFTLAGGTVTANGLATAIATVQKLTLKGGAGNDTYALNSSTVPAAIVDTGGYNTVDFSKDTAGVNVNLGLDHGQAQSIAPWKTTLAITGVINKLIGTAFSDVLTGGRAATTLIRGGSGSDTITGGSGDNILVGGGGNDTITGGAGANLLIAGSGNCTLIAKGKSDIVFAGSTSADANDQALMTLLQDKSRVSYGYSARRILASSAKNPVLAASPVTFLDSGGHDTVIGKSLIKWLTLGRFGTVNS